MNTIPQNLVAMAYVRGAVGVKGWLKIKADTEFSDGLMQYENWYIGKEGQWQRVEPQSGKMTPDGLQVKFKGVDDRDAAEALQGMTISVSRDDFPQENKDEYYWVDLVGMTVKNSSGDTLGKVRTLNESGAHDLLVVDGQEKSQLIPFVDRFILDVDRESKTITADWEKDY